MKILILQLDGKIPNIALMRISAHHKSKGDEVELRRAGNLQAVERQFGDNHDLVYASLIFQQTKKVAERVQEIYPNAIIGGTGWNLENTLEQHGIETKVQDYSIYPRWQQSIGFTQRGCRLKCPFCVVPLKEGKITEEQSIYDLWRGDPYPRELILLDNDFFGQPNWQKRIEEIKEGNFKVSFNQGINARFLTDETATAIASIDYRDDQMKTKRIYTAWDNRKDEKRLFNGLELLVKHGVKPDHIMVYMLIGYWEGETHVDREQRRAKLREFGARPYPMPFVRTPELVGFQRWVIGAYDKPSEQNPDGVSWERWVKAKYQPSNLGNASNTACSGQVGTLRQNSIIQPELFPVSWQGSNPPTCR